ncbi:MAG: alcohol dehydrogenase catalytic domain-containing protein [Lachnospiraceae bacterium]|jgi:threonine dehydrogenase-like Zn-dependent dehydrogenase
MSIPKTMKALVAYGQNEYRLETEFPVPEIDDEQILIKTEACGICAGDVKAQHGAAKFWGDANQPAWVKPPFIPGHEFIGEVVAVGAKSPHGVEVGDRVTVEQIAPCGECRYCKSGKYWMCQKHDIYGFQSNVNGGMAEYVRVNKSGLVYKVPKDLPMEKAILVEPYACAKHCIDRAQITYDDVVVISGAGPLGLGMLGAARLSNPKKLIVLDLKKERLDKALEFGADLVFNPMECDVVEEIKKITDGYGCDIYVEATGAPASVIQGLNMVRKLGRFIEFSVFGSETTVDWSIIGDTKELDLLGAHLSPYCFPTVIDWINEGKLPTEGVTSHVFSIDDWQEAFEVAGKGDGSMKVVLKL